MRGVEQGCRNAVIVDILALLSYYDEQSSGLTQWKSDAGRTKDGSSRASQSIKSKQMNKGK